MPSATASGTRPVGGGERAEGDADRRALLDDLDAAFGNIVGPRSGDVGLSLTRPEPAPPPPDVRELFGAMAGNYMRPVRDLMIGIQWGEPVAQYLTLSGPSLSSLVGAATQMDLGELAKALGELRDAFGAAEADRSGAITPESRTKILSAYAKAAAEMPEAFALDGEQNRREAVIVHSLLRQVPEINKVSIDKLYAGGLASLDVLRVARPLDIATTIGITETLASAIVARFQAYLREIHEMPLGAQRAAERERLVALTGELRQAHERYEEAANAWTDGSSERKKKLREARGEMFLQIRVLLARLGEFDRLGELDKMTFQRRIQALEAFLRETKPGASRTA